MATSVSLFFSLSLSIFPLNSGGQQEVMSVLRPQRTWLLRPSPVSKAGVRHSAAAGREEEAGPQSGFRFIEFMAAWLYRSCNEERENNADGTSDNFSQVLLKSLKFMSGNTLH